MHETTPQVQASRRSPRWAGVLIRLGLLLVALVAAGELVSRYWLGLGDPPLSLADPEIEYLFKPSMTYHRFGNTIRYNAHSMRSPEVAPAKTDPGELRVMVFSDSIINGGAMTDDAQLATTLMDDRLSQEWKRPVFVGNISAGSWGPPNQLAYAKRFGLFDADLVLIVVNSGDAYDVPTFEPIVGVNPGFPDRAPLSALSEAIGRYLLPRLFPQSTAPATVAGSEITPENQEKALGALRSLIQMARMSGAPVIVAYFPQAVELGGTPEYGYDLLRDVAAKSGAAWVDLTPALKSAAGARPADALYRDSVHPNPAGQKVIADALVPMVSETLARRPDAPAN